MSEEKTKQPGRLFWLNQIWFSIRVPLAAIILALLIGAVILIFSGVNPLEAYQALFAGAFGETRYLLRTFEKTTPLIFSGLAVAFAFKAGLFNIGAQGQLLLGAMTSAALGFMITGLPPLIHIPLALIGGALVGALYGAIPGALKTFTGAHEVITTIMLNYIAINITDYLADGPFKDPSPTNIVARTPKIADSAVIPTPEFELTTGLLITLGVILLLSILFFAVLKKYTLKINSKMLLFLVRFILVVGLGTGVGFLLNTTAPEFYSQTPDLTFYGGTLVAVAVAFLTAILLFALPKKPILTIKASWVEPLIKVALALLIGFASTWVVSAVDYSFYAKQVNLLPYTTIPMPLGFLIAIVVAVIVWFILMKTSLGFEIRTIGLNQHAAKYAGIKVSWMFILAMVISGALAGLGGAVETQGVVLRYQPGFNTGLGFDGITVALLGRNSPLGVIPAAFLIGAMQAGSNVMQFQAGVPAEIIDVIQALILFFVAADMIVRWIIGAKSTAGEIKTKLTTGWGNQ
jgi:simple sugar transport system permease protein